MITRVDRIIVLVGAVVLLVSCCGAPDPNSSNGQSSELYSDVGVDWAAEHGIDLTAGIAVPVRAYLESYDIVEFSGNLKKAYPGFTDAVPPNASPEQSGDMSTWSRRPSEANPLKVKLIGNNRFRILSVERSDKNANVIVCKYRYGLAEVSENGIVSQFTDAGFAEDRGIVGVKLTLVIPDGDDIAHLPVQSGPATKPKDNVFGDWQITGYLTTTAASAESWPAAANVQATCSATAPDSLEYRQTLIRGPLSADMFSASPSAPGWPE